MPDISMCQGRGCAERNKCYRHRARPSEHRQTWAPFDEDPKPCKMFSLIFNDYRLRDPSPEPEDDDGS